MTAVKGNPTRKPDRQSGPNTGLPVAASYFPLSSGIYEIKPGLHNLGQDFGNGEADKRLFQIDRNFPHYRRVKLAAREERLSKYFLTAHLTIPMESAVGQFVTQRLLAEYPYLFKLEPGPAGTRVLHCALTGERLVLGDDWRLRKAVYARGNVDPPYLSIIDALAMQIQEDLALVSLGEDGRDWLSALHLCLPNHWAPEEKIGCDFATIHQPVPEIEPISRNAAKIVRAMIKKGPYARFAWGLSSDRRLNHHPQPPLGVDPVKWRGRRFNQSAPELYLRVERQVTWGLPRINSSLFTIRTYFTDCKAIKAERRKNRRLQTAIESMMRASLVYKGISGQDEAILAWLRS